MTTFQAVMAAAAVITAAVPQIKQAAGWLLRLPTPTPPDQAAPSYRDAIANLAAVRLRLKATGKLDDDQKQAIDVLTLALVDGSDE
jgi:hypothetical protein